MTQGTTRLAYVAAVLGATALAACGTSDSSSDREGRVTRVTEACNGHGGVVAFDDEAVICEDQTSNSERASRAVDACGEHGGVAAFDDDIVICRDQTSHAAQEG